MSNIQQTFKIHAWVAATSFPTAATAYQLMALLKDYYVSSAEKATV